MASVITAISLGATGQGTERIQQVYVPTLGGWLKVSEVVRRIDVLGQAFRSQSASGPLVETAVSSNGYKFIRTNANGTATDNLLSLPNY